MQTFHITSPPTCTPGGTPEGDEDWDREIYSSQSRKCTVCTKCGLSYALHPLLLHLPSYCPENSAECRLHTKTVDMEYSFLLSRWQSPSLGMTMPANLLSIPKWESASLTKTRRWRESFRQPIFSCSERETFGLHWIEAGIYGEWINYDWTHSEYKNCIAGLFQPFSSIVSW